VTFFIDDINLIPIKMQRTYLYQYCTTMKYVAQAHSALKTNLRIPSFFKVSCAMTSNDHGNAVICRINNKMGLSLLGKSNLFSPQNILWLSHQHLLRAYDSVSFVQVTQIIEWPLRYYCNGFRHPQLLDIFHSIFFHHFCEILTCNLQPPTCNLQPAHDTHESKVINSK